MSKSSSFVLKQKAISRFFFKMKLCAKTKASAKMIEQWDLKKVTLLR